MTTYTLSGVPTDNIIARNLPYAVVTGGTLVNVTGPTSPGSGNNGIYTYFVRWDNPQANRGIIEPKIEKPVYANGSIVRWDPASIQTLNVTLRNLSLVSLGTIVPTGDLAFGGNTPLTLSVPAVNVLPGQPASEYYWTIPSGWVYAYGNIVSTGTRVRIPGTASNSISVTPLPQGSSATVRVSAGDGACSQGNTLGTETAEAVLTFNRPVPPLTIISNKSPNGGNFSLFCGEQLSNQQVRPSAGGPPINWSNYNFSRSGSITSFCCLSTSAPGLYFNSIGSGTIGLTATYTRNGASTTVAAQPITVTALLTMAPITLQPIPQVCPGQIIRVQASPVPGATAYEWVVPAQFTTPGLITTTDPFLDLTAISGGFNTLYDLVVRARNGSCTPSETFATGQFGAGANVVVSSNAGAGEYEVCAGRTFNITAYFTGIGSGPLPSASYDYTITITDANGNTSDTNESGPSISITTPPAGQWIDIALDVTTSCGTFRRVSAGGWRSVTQYGNGNWCLGERSTPAVQVAPNPADAELVVSAPQDTKFRSALLYNTQGVVVQQAHSEAVRLVLDVRALPNGLYYLVLQDKMGNITRKTVQVRH